MPPERYRRIRELFEAALEEGPSERDAFLRQACTGDPQLEREVRDILVAYRSAESFLESGPGIHLLRVAATESTSSSGDVPEFLGTDRFNVIRRLGAGGFGVVYEAADLHYNSVVALKTLPSADRDRIERFKREFRALPTSPIRTSSHSTSSFRTSRTGSSRWSW